MGCYLSKPDDKVYLTEGKGRNFRYVTASCQGWRRDQEDAEDCIPFFDEQHDASLFILCDGHGGHEVAKYTVEHYPGFLKKHPLYKEGNYAEALRDSFIEFDALLRTDEVMEELKRISKEVDTKDKEPDSTTNDTKMDVKEDDEPSSSNNQPSCSSASGSSAGCSSAGPSTSTVPSAFEDDVDAETLKREAALPIDELLSKYSDQNQIKSRVNSLWRKNLIINASPVVRSSKELDRDGDDEASAEDEKKGADNIDADLTDSSQPSSSKGESSPLSGYSAQQILKMAMDRYFKTRDDDDDSESNDEEFEVAHHSEDDDDDEDDEEEEDSEDDDDNDNDNDNEDGDDEGDEGCAESGKKSRRFKPKKLRGPASLRAVESSSSSDEDDDDEDDDDGDDVDEDEDEEDDEDEIEFSTEWLRSGKFKLDQSRTNQPGVDSGCTVVVALVINGHIYVASAGDSRCILLLRENGYRPLSFDHKPEDPTEHQRIVRAGGRVVDGRVNGGLNLSRAFGDFAYKDKHLNPRRQMITPLPDVKVSPLTKNTIEYVVLACDGIWNSLTNQQVEQFIRRTSEDVGDDLAELSMRLFKKCIATDTGGDGTGCDNMTCIIAKFEFTNGSPHHDLKTSTVQHLRERPSETSPTKEISSCKRAAEDDELHTLQKKICVRRLDIFPDDAEEKG